MGGPVVRRGAPDAEPFPAYILSARRPARPPAAPSRRHRRRPRVTVAAVPERDITEWDEFTGRLEAVDAVEIRPRVSGYIERVAFAEGKEVRKGDVLFEIDPRPYQAALDRAEAQLEQARTRSELAARESERAQRLVEEQAISREEFDARTSGNARATPAVRAAEAAVRPPRLNLDWTRGARADHRPRRAAPR